MKALLTWIDVELGHFEALESPLLEHARPDLILIDRVVCVKLVGGLSVPSPVFVVKRLIEQGKEC